jgi:DNA-binding CsgD family transcriptional regulator
MAGTSLFLPRASSPSPARLRPSNGAAVRSDPHPHAWRGLQERYHLTGAECRVALLLAGGLGATELSTRLGVSRNTVKTQIQAVYQKLGVHRQLQLISVLAGSHVWESSLPLPSAVAALFSLPLSPAAQLFPPAGTKNPFFVPSLEPPFQLRARVALPPRRPC